MQRHPDHTRRDSVQPDTIESPLGHPAPGPTLMDKRGWWTAALVLVSLLPFVSLGYAHGISLPFRESFLIGLGVFVGGVCHVASTAYFYCDREALALMRPMKVRFVLLPALAVALSAATLRYAGRIEIPELAVMTIFGLHLVWLYFHYQRQNYGLLAFTAAAHAVRLPPAMLPILMLAAVAGGLASFPQLLENGLETDLHLAAWQTAIKQSAAAIYTLAGLAIGVVAYRHRSVFAKWPIMLFTLISFGFFVPALLFEHVEYAFWSYAIAHGLQYLLMVAIVSAGARLPWPAIALFLLIAVGGGWCLKQFAGTPALFVCGILLTWVHFILDARLWRMSDNQVRQFLTRRFAFIFNRLV
jgi:hypothetical protein